MVYIYNLLQEQGNKRYFAILESINQSPHRVRFIQEKRAFEFNLNYHF